MRGAAVDRTENVLLQWHGSLQGRLPKPPRRRAKWRFAAAASSADDARRHLALLGEAPRPVRPRQGRLGRPLNGDDLTRSQPVWLLTVKIGQASRPSPAHATQAPRRTHGNNRPAPARVVAAAEEFQGRSPDRRPMRRRATAEAVITSPRRTACIPFRPFDRLAGTTCNTPRACPPASHFWGVTTVATACRRGPHSPRKAMA
jgi:hypothetical protein